MRKSKVADREMGNQDQPGLSACSITMRSSFLLLFFPVSCRSSADYRLVGRTGTDDQGTPSFGWPVSGIALKTTGKTMLALNLSLPVIERYDVKGIEDGVRLSAFVDGVFYQDFLVKPGLDIHEIEVEEAAEVKIVRVSEDIYAVGSNNAPTLHGLSSSSPIQPLPIQPTILFVGDSDTAGETRHVRKQRSSILGNF